jgi:putative serine protease PepD
VLPFADSDSVRVGDTAIAIGYPLGLDRTATAGIVSGLGREIRAPNGFTIDEVIQTDAPINPGNSGGPLIDASGRVIGVNSQIATAGSQGNVGIGFAVPSNTVREIVPKLKGGQSIERPYLGVETAPALNGRGASVRRVTPGGPAEKAGIRGSSSLLSDDGDVIVQVEGRGVTEPDDVAQAIEGKRPGDRVTVTVLRDGDEREIEVTLAERPAQVRPVP